MDAIAKNVYIEERFPGVTLGVIVQSRGLIQIDAPPAPEDGRSWRASLMGMGNGHERVVREFRDKIFHVHAKDLHIDWEGVYNHGVLSQGMGWQIPRLPGLGDMDWGKFFAALTGIGYDYVVSIEHEDRAFEGDEELVKRGFYLSRDVLKPYFH